MATYTSQYPVAQSDTYVKSTTKYSTDYWAYYATDPAKSLTGSNSGNGWLSASGQYQAQRFHIDLGSAKIIKRIYVENFHHSGGSTDRGIKKFYFWGSNTMSGTFDDLVYGNDGGWTELTPSTDTVLEHSGADESDPQYITVTNTTAYRYYAFKIVDNYGNANYMGVRRLELQTEDVAPTVTTQTVSNIQKTTATGNGNITATGGANCTTRGFCYMTGTSGDPTTANSKVYDTGSFGVGAFSKGLTGLTAGTNYRVRAYAINSAGTAYGATVQTQTRTEKAVSETINIVDSKVTSFTKAIAEAFSIVDSFISRLALGESLNTTDSIIRMGSEAKAESFNTTDSWTARISLAEVFNTIDSLVNSASLAKSEAFNIIDSWLGRLKLSEAFQTVDSFMRTTFFYLAETLGVIDSYKTGAIWIEEIKNVIDWIEGDGTGWFSSWFSKGWFSGSAFWTEEIKETINWTKE